MPFISQCQSENLASTESQNTSSTLLSGYHLPPYIHISSPLPGYFWPAPSSDQGNDVFSSRRPPNILHKRVWGRPMSAGGGGGYIRPIVRGGSDVYRAGIRRQHKSGEGWIYISPGCIIGQQYQRIQSERTEPNNE